MIKIIKFKIKKKLKHYMLKIVLSKSKYNKIKNKLTN